MNTAQEITANSASEYDSICEAKLKCFETKIEDNGKTFIFRDNSTLFFPFTDDNKAFLVSGMVR
ncbi:hypothetical protein [Vibrio owensii]|uniref:hypothetical protein n=1 Tax=Vibrio harveyi group TaxID=717610 RepID=UPI003CC558DE